MLQVQRKLAKKLLYPHGPHIFLRNQLSGNLPDRFPNGVNNPPDAILYRGFDYGGISSYLMITPLKEPVSGPSSYKLFHLLLGYTLL